MIELNHILPLLELNIPIGKLLLLHHLLTILPKELPGYGTDNIYHKEVPDRRNSTQSGF